MSGAEPTPNQNISVYRFDAKLNQTSVKSWSIGQDQIVPPLQALPGGDLAAIVRPASGGKLVLTRWTLEGAGILRRELDAAEIVAVSEAAGELTVVTPGEIQRISLADGHTLARRPLASSLQGLKKAEASSRGAWLLFDDRIVYVPLEGPAMTMALPLVKARATDCRPNEPCGRVASHRDLYALPDEACIVTESLVSEYSVKGQAHAPDQVRLSVLSLLGSDAQIMAQSPVGQVSAKKEWFWSRQSPSNPTIVPDEMGLVRTRHEGGPGISSVGARGNGDIIVMTDDRNVVRLDRKLDESWRQSIQSPGRAELSPAWTKDILVANAGSAFTEISEDGKRSRKGYYEDAAADSRFHGRFPRTAIGQTSAGGWIIVNY
jgi:hypothetical protein